MAILCKDASLFCPCLQLLRSGELKRTQTQSEKFGDSTWRVFDLPQHTQQDLLALFNEALQPRITAALAKNDKDNVRHLLCLALRWKADASIGCHYKVQFAKMAKVFGMTFQLLNGTTSRITPQRKCLQTVQQMSFPAL